MSEAAIVASGGFAAPAYRSRSMYKPLIRDMIRDLPAFTAARGGIVFEDPAERWARERELELRKLTQMWDWP